VAPVGRWRSQWGALDLYQPCPGHPVSLDRCLGSTSRGRGFAVEQRMPLARYFRGGPALSRIADKFAFSASAGTLRAPSLSGSRAPVRRPTQTLARVSRESADAKTGLLKRYARRAGVILGLPDHAVMFDETRPRRAVSPAPSCPTLERRPELVVRARRRAKRGRRSRESSVLV
jgi:hypothetical protein